MTLGIAIPTYQGHLYNLKNLLEQLSKSTVIPNEVSISISSLKEPLEIVGDYPFELIITETKEFRNVSQNCNIAASKLSTDIISFFGGDDIPHIKRNEYLLKSFVPNVNAVVHDYIINPNKEIKEFTDDVGELDFLIDYIDTPVKENCFPLSSRESHLSYANGPISIRKEIFDKFKYNEDNNFFKREDSVYNNILVKNGVNISYIRNKLMIYIH